jgi:AAHS family 4-hydroxybenzoate transporter-like MFS transporter
MLQAQSAAGIEIGQLIDKGPVRAIQVRIIALCGAVMLLDGYDIQTMALAVPALIGEWGLKPASFGLALSASLIGLMLGAVVIAPFGDRLGRRPLLIGGMVLVGLASIGTAFSLSPQQLTLWRLLTGLGLGAGIPNATTLTSDYVPSRRRAALVTLMFCNISVGAFAAGFLAPVIVEHWSWRALFAIGGILPLLVSILLALTVPESVRFLLARRPGDPRIRKAVTQIAPRVAVATVRADAVETPRQSLPALFTPNYRARTGLLWGAFSINLFVLYALISWVPTLLRGAGWPAADAARGVGMINAGGVFAGLLLALLVDRNKARPALLGAYICVAVSLVLFSLIPSGSIWWLLLLLVGGGSAGAQMTLNAVTAATYPAEIRAAGVGWATGIGRMGAALGPIVTSVIVSRDISADRSLSLLAAPILVCMVCVWSLFSIRSRLQVATEPPADEQSSELFH